MTNDIINTSSDSHSNYTALSPEDQEREQAALKAFAWALHANIVSGNTEPYATLADFEVRPKCIVF